MICWLIELLIRNDIQVALKKKYNDTHKSSKSLLSGSEWYCHQAFRALNQAAGMPWWGSTLSVPNWHLILFCYWGVWGVLLFYLAIIFCITILLYDNADLIVITPVDNSLWRCLLLSIGRCIRHRFDYGAIILLGNCSKHTDFVVLLLVKG